MADDPVQIPINQDDADGAARIIADMVETHAHSVLVEWIKDGTLPDIGFLKLEEMSNRLGQIAVQPAFNTIHGLGHPERCPVRTSGRRRKAARAY